MTILVTGGLGHIGSRLIQDLLVRDRVVVIDSLETQRYSSIFALSGKNCIDFIEADISKVIPSALRDYQPISTVIHLAAKNHGQSSRSLEFEQNLKLTESAIQIALYYSSHLIFPSSSSVYAQTAGIHDEKVALNFPVNKYSSVKLQEENLIMSSELERWTILRLGTLHGVSPGMRFHTAVNKFCWDARTRGYIEVWESALDETKPYLSLDDCVSALIFFTFNVNFASGIWNLASNHHKTSEIVSLIQDFSKSKVDLRTVDSNFESSRSILLSLNKIDATGLKFKGSLTNDVKATLELLNGLI